MATKRRYKHNNPGTEDSAVLMAEYNRAYNEYVADQKPTVTDMLMLFNGNKGDLAQALADATNTKRASQMKSIDRWLAYEKGERGAQARNPANSKTMERFAALYATKNPPSGMYISINGNIGYPGGDFRDRTIDFSTSEYAVNMSAFVSAMNAGDTHAAYRAIFANYADLIVAEAYNIDISFS